MAAGLMLALYAPAIFFDGLIQKSVLDFVKPEWSLGVAFILLRSGRGGVAR